MLVQMLLHQGAQQAMFPDAVNNAMALNAAAASMGGSPDAPGMHATGALTPGKALDPNDFQQQLKKVGL